MSARENAAARAAARLEAQIRELAAAAKKVAAAAPPLSPGQIERLSEIFASVRSVGISFSDSSPVHDLTVVDEAHYAAGEGLFTLERLSELDYVSVAELTELIDAGLLPDRTFAGHRWLTLAVLASGTEFVLPVEDSVARDLAQLALSMCDLEYSQRQRIAALLGGGRYE